MTHGGTLIDKMADAAYVAGMYESQGGLTENVATTTKNEAHEALTEYVKALEAKPTVLRSAETVETVEVGPPEPDVKVFEEGFNGSEIEYDKRVKELREFGMSPRGANAGSEHLRPKPAPVVKLTTLPLRIIDIEAKVNGMELNGGSMAAYVELTTGERLRLIGIGRRWLRLITASGEIRENVSPGEVVQVIV